MLFNVFVCFQVQNVLICLQKNLEIFKIDVLKRGTTAEKGRCQRKARNIENMVCCFTAERFHKQLNVSISRNSLFLCFKQSVYLFLYCKLSSERVFLGFKCTCVWIMFRACTVIELCEEYLMKTRSLEYSYRFYWRIVTIFAPFSFFHLQQSLKNIEILWLHVEIFRFPDSWNVDCNVFTFENNEKLEQHSSL